MSDSQSRLPLNGKRFGRLVVQTLFKSDDRGRSWLCLCDCGNEAIVRTPYLICGDTKSCGCIRKEKVRKMASHSGTSNGRYKHGEYVGRKTPEMCAYMNAKQRCNNPKNKRYDDWGGRGIKFLFTDFKQFFAETGRKPTSNHQLDRINNNGNYEPGNIRWVTSSEQNLNRRNNGGSKKRNIKTGRFMPMKKEK